MGQGRKQCSRQSWHQTSCCSLRDSREGRRVSHLEGRVSATLSPSARKAAPPSCKQFCVCSAAVSTEEHKRPPTSGRANQELNIFLSLARNPSLSSPWASGLSSPAPDLVVPLPPRHKQQRAASGYAIVRWRCCWCHPLAHHTWKHFLAPCPRRRGKAGGGMLVLEGLTNSFRFSLCSMYWKCPGINREGLFHYTALPMMLLGLWLLVLVPSSHLQAVSLLLLTASVCNSNSIS